MKNIFCFLIFQSYFASPKLIGSNTLQRLSSIELYEQDINLTVWVQFRFPIKFQDQELIEALKIIDQDLNDQLIIQLYINDESLMAPLFILQNKSIKSSELKRENWKLEWQKISIQREICFNRLQYFDINMSVTCDNPFNATLFINQSISFHIYVYDLEQFENEEIILSNIFSIQNKYIINTLKDNLAVQFYAKLYSGQDTQIFFFFTLMTSQTYLFYQYSSNNIEIVLQDQEKQLYLIKQIDIQGDQWVLFGMEFDELDIIIQYNTNNTNNIVVVQIDHYLNVTITQYLQYQFKTICMVLNTKATAIKYLQIISLSAKKDKNSCSNACLFCLYNQCFDQKKPSFDFNISNQIRSSKYYNETYFQNYQLVCDDKRYNSKNQNCIEIPKYNGKYCYNCQFLQRSINQMNEHSYVGFRTSSYDYYLENLYNFPQDNPQKNNGLFLESDLNIYILRGRDIYYTYKLSNQVFCEQGYQFFHKCKKNFKKCQVQILSCFVCSKQYAIINHKCIRCQKNCLYCKIIKNKLICILFRINYYENNLGLIKQCLENSDIINCLPKDQAINQLTQKGYEVCQHHEIFDIEASKCQDMKQFKVIFKFLKYYQFYKYEEQLLEIQDLLAEQPEQVDLQIQSLISIQQVNKLAGLVQQCIKNQSTLDLNKNFELLSEMNSSLVEIAIKKTTLYNVKVYLQEIPIVIYENKHYEKLINIYEQLQIKPKIIQYNLILIIQKIEKNLNTNLEISDKDFPDIIFIFNISFNVNPSILHKYSNVLYLRANQIIINNLIFDQINKQFEQNFDETVFSQFLFHIKSENITIYNLTIQNMEFSKLFFLEDFKKFKMYNLQISNSSIVEFIKGLRIMTKYQIIDISNFYCQICNLTDFIYFSGSQLIDLSNIIYVSSQLNGYNFEFNGTINSINIKNQWLINVTLYRCRLLYAKYQDKFDNTNFLVSNLYIEDSNFINSAFILLQNVNQLEMKQIYMYYLTLQESIFGNIIYIAKAHFEGLYTQKLTLEQGFSFIKIEVYNKTTFKDFYFRNFISVKQKLFYLRGIVTLVKNLNFNEIDLTAYDLIIIESLEIQILKLMISNLICVGGVSGTGDTIKIFSEKLNIRGIVFKSGLVNGTQLLLIQTAKKLRFIYFYIQRLNVITFNQDQLISFISLFIDNVVSYVYLKQINIETKDKNYTIFKFSNQKVSCNYIILNVQVKDIKNKSPVNTIYTIYTDITQMEIFNLKILNTYSINFIYSSSSSLFLQYFYIDHIIRKFIDYSSFIMHKSPLIDQTETLQIHHFQVNYFQGIFISAFTDNKMNAVLYDLSFNETISIFEFFEFMSLSVSKQTQLQIHRVQILNQINIKTKSQKAFIEANFDSVSITLLYLQVVYKQILRTFQSRFISIIGVYVNQYYFNDSVIYIYCDSFASQIKLSKFTIYNSSIEKGSVFELVLDNHLIVIDTIQFSDLYVEYSVIKLVSTNDKQIKLSDILLESVTSDQYLFQIESQVNYFTTSVIRVLTPQIFSSNNKKIGYINGLITDIIEQCLLSQNSLIFLNQSEIVNSNIIQHLDQIIRYQSQYLGMFSNVKQNMMIFFSLNRGKSFFNQLQIYDNVYQIQFSKNNSYLYLPSGRDVQGYLYFNFARREYTRLYDSISYVSLYQAQTTQCILKQKLDNETIHKQDLLLQPGVNQVENLTFTLNPYYKDKHIELDLICNQNESQITYRTLIKTFNCQLGEFLFKDQCILCNIEQYFSYSVGYNQQYCLMKDPNIIEKLNVGQIKLYKTYWRHSYANKYIEQCKNQNCLGGWHTGDHSCEVGYVGALCSECDVYNVRGQGNFGKIDNQCSLCYFNYSIYLKGMLTILFQLLLIYISQNANQQLSQQFLFMRISKRKFTEILQRQNINQVTVLFKLYYNYIFTIYLLKESIEFGQVVDLSLNMVYNPSFIAVPQFDCLIYSLVQYPAQYTQLIIKILLPISLLNFIVIIYAFMIKFQASKYSISIIIACLLIIHQQHQQVILQSLIKLLSSIKYSNIYWTLENLNIEYYSKTHQYYLLVLVIPLIAIITFMNILIFMWIKYINKRINVHLKLSLFIYKQYKNQFYYWEYFRLASIYLYMIILYSYDNNYIILLTILILMISHIYKPFELQNINQIDQIIYIVSLLTYFGILIHQRDDSPNKFIIIIISNLILLKIFLKYFFHSFNIQYRQKKIQYLNKMISYMPNLGTYINTQTYYKTEYYYYLLKQRRKYKTAMNTIVQSTISQLITEVQKIEVEMAQLNKIK